MRNSTPIERIEKKLTDDLFTAIESFTTTESAVTESGKIQIIENLVFLGADINATDENQRTPLHIAVRSGNKDIIKFLKRSGADVNVEDKDGITPLQIAAEINRKDIVRILENPLENPGARDVDKDGRTPLHIAVKNNDKKNIKDLLDSGADTNVTDKDGRTPLHLAVEYLAAKYTVPNVREVIHILKKFGANVDAQDQDGTAPIHIAAKKGFDSVMRDLNRKVAGVGANVDIKDKMGMAPIHFAVLSGSEQAVNVLRDIHADFNVLNHAGETPFDMLDKIENLEVRDRLRAELNKEPKNSHRKNTVARGTSAVPAQPESRKRVLPEGNQQETLEEISSPSTTCEGPNLPLKKKIMREMAGRDL